MKKRLLLYVFMLFAFLSGKAQVGHAFYVEPEGSVNLLNNIIIHNGDSNLNVVTPPYNLTTEDARVFMDAETNFFLYYFSPAVDMGINSACNWLFDLADTLRICDGAIDLGAYEFVNTLNFRQYAVHQVQSGHLYLCNNVIVNNPMHTSMANVMNGGTSNILSDSILVFRDPNIDFSLYASSPAVNAGQNSCNRVPFDLQKKRRICEETIDIGAFEHEVVVIEMDSVFVVFQNEEGSLTLCNNIDINNSVYAGNTNAGNVFHNIFTDNDSLFVDNLENFMPREGSPAIDAGLNDCNMVEKDLSDEDRIMGENVDIGAYEQYVPSEEDSLVLWQYVVHQEETGHLLLCNNIIVNNPAHDEVTNLEVVPSNNILSDSVPVFCDELINFKIFEGSPAVDSGWNSCYTGPGVDIDMLPRIARSAIDIGAFELPVRNDTTAGGGGSGGGGGGGGGSGGGSDYYHTTVFHQDGDTLYLCNNIIINNSVFITNARPDADTVYNILVDQDSLFVDNLENFMPRDSSIAVNSGANDCNSLELDLFTHPRVYAEIIDIGAYEQFSEESDILQFDQLLIHQLDEGQLHLCNNIIVNNFAHAAMTNIEEIPASNILSDSITLFIDPINNFSLFRHSPAVNAGADSCCTWVVDIARNPRVVGDTIDVGAFEYSAPVVYSDTTFTVLQADTSELWLCNNILINNSSHSVNTNIENLPSNNIWQDNDSIFTDNQYNFLPLPLSIAVNRGSNECQDVQVDLAQHPRVMAEIIDIGAYEQFEDEQDSIVIAAVHQEDTAHQLRLYNNIIINNPGHTHNYAGSLVDSHNMLEDTPDVFVDITSDFSLMVHSPAIDTGANEWVSWRYDLKDDERISCANIVDLGAFEYSYDDVAVALTATEVLTDNCMGSYILLQATPGAQHYIWSHTNEDTCELAVSPLVSTSYTVVATNGGACRDTATIQISPSSSPSDSIGTPSSIGKTFWLSYLRNHFREPELTVQLSAERACSGVVSNPRTSWSVPFTVGAHSVTTVTIPLEQAYPMNANAVGDFGILVEATDTISVYAANYNNNSFDVTVVLPVNALDDEYMVQTYVPTMNSEFVIVATEDNTEVEITPSKALMGGHAARQTYVVTMQRGQTYLGISRFGGAMGDLSGSIIKARDGKRVAVFNGNVCAMVPTTNSYTDHLVEQAVGVKYWGRSFALTTTESQNFDMVRVTALRSNTVISKNGTAMATIQTGETYEFQLMGSEGSCFLETSQPAGVYLYVAGAVQGNDQELSDPSMIWIPPVEQKMNDLTFATFQSPGISDHYVNVVIPAEALDEISMDGQLIGNEFSLMPTNPQFAFVRKHILPGTHSLQCDQGFIAHVYGLGYHESYGYAAGSKAEALKEQLLVNEIPSADLPANQRFCPYEPIDFRVKVNYSCDSVLWNFGDSSNIVNAMSTTHAFTEAGSYAVSATLFLTSGEVVFCTNMYVRINVIEGYGTVYYDTICYGERYLLHGFDVEADEAGHFTHTRTVEMPGMYCDSTYVLELEVLNNVVRIEDTICEQNLYDQYGFTILATNVGLMTDTLFFETSSSGCDSMRILNLLVTPNMEHIPEIIGEAYPCVGEVFSYSLDSLSSLQDVSWMVPDSVVIVAQPDDYHISLLFESSDENYEISVQGHNRCGDTILRKMIYPQPYSYVQLVDTICDNHRHYQRYGFDIAYVPDTSDVYVHHDVSSMGCDSTTVLAIVIVPTYRVTDTIVVCETDLPYQYQDSLLATEGTYTLGLYSQCGCDSVVDLTLLVNPSTYATIDDTVRYYDLPYELNGSFYDTSGVYTQTLQNANSYGCDSIITLRLTVLYNITVQMDSVICQRELPFVWNSVTFTVDTNPGTPVILIDTAILPLPRGVDSIVVMQVTVNPTTYGTVSLLVVENAMPTSYNGIIYDSAGVYVQQLTNAQGCDSVLTIELTVLDNVTNTVDSTICESDLPLIWDGVTFTDEGTHIDTLIAHTGADSVVVRNLHVIALPVITHTPDTAILGGDYAILWASGANLLSWTDSNGNPVGEGASVTVRPLTSGYYYVTAYSVGEMVLLTPILLCQITDSIWVEVLPNPDTMLLNESACVHYVWYGDTLTQSGIYYQGMTNQLGYDSVEVLSLTIYSLTYGLLDTTVVENALPLTINDSTYREAGTFTQYLTNAMGCDSILTVNLTVIPNVMVEVDTSVCEDDFPLTWNDSVFVRAGTKTFVLPAHTGADSVVVMTVHELVTTYGSVDTAVLQNDLPWEYYGASYSIPGIYTQTITNAVGCDSVVTINLTEIYNVVAIVDSVVCAFNTPFDWNGITFTQTTTRVAHLTASTGADSTLVMRVTVIYTTYGTLDTTVLENDLPFVWNGESYNTEGYFNQYLQNYAGCDSILTIHLRILYNKRVVVDSVLCETELPLEWNGVVFDIADVEPFANTLLLVDSITTQASTGADSTVVMTLYVNPTTYGTLDTTVLVNDLPLWLHGLPYSSDSTFTQTFVGANANGCDSVLTVNMTVLYNVTVPLDSVICQTELPLSWNGIIFNYTSEEPLVAPLTLVDSVTLLASTGVDSMVVMTVIVNPTTYGTLDTTVMENDLPLVLNGFSYMTDSIFSQTLSAANTNGCDSVLTVSLTVLYNEMTALYDTVCENQLPFVWNGVQFNVAGTQDTVLTASTGVDSTVVMTLYVNPITYGTLDTTVLENELPLSLNGFSYMTDSIFTQTLSAVNANGCDSVLTVSLTVLYNMTTTLYDTICENQLPTVWNGVGFDAAGTQDTVLTASTGVDSMVVMTLYVNSITYGTLDITVLENNLPLMLNGFEYMTDSVFTQTLSAANANGCDSVLTVSLTVLYNEMTTLYDTVCENQLPFVWNGVSFDAAGTQDTVLTASTGVDSTVVMTLYVNPITFGTLDTTVLENNLPLMLNGFEYMTDSVFTQTLSSININGCDSILTVNLTVRNNVITSLYDTICENQLPITWNGVLFDAAGTQDTVLTASTGVDSTVVMTLYVNPITYRTLDTTVLENDLPLQLNGFSYMTDSIFTQTLSSANANGCDSVLTVNMTVLYNVTVEVDSIICDGELPFTWNTVTFATEDIDSVTASVTDSVVLTASTGVDSTVVMTVHVHYANTGVDVQTACDSYTWIDGVTYTASTDSVTYTLTNAAGCDSVVTLHLTVNHSVVSQDTLVLIENQLPYYFTVADTTIGNNAPAEFQFSYHLSTIQGCDSTIEQTVFIHYNTHATVDTMVCASSLPYTWHGHQYTQAGSYNDTILNADGSDHVITYQLNVSNPAVTVQSITHVNCYGDSTGGVGILVSGGIQPYNCHWEDNSGTTVSSMAQLVNQPAGKYRLYALDAMGCVVVDSVSLQHQNDSMVAGVIASDRLVCHGSGVGGFTGTAASGGASSVYQWQISANGTDWTAAPSPNNAQNYTYPNLVTSSFSLRRAWVSQACGTVYSNVVTVNVAPVYNDTLRENVCQGYPYQEYGFDVTAEETAQPAVITRVRNLQSVNSCDSTVTLVLTVIPSTHTMLTDESCQHVPYQANGFDLAADELGTVGVHTFERVYTTSGCDSIVTLQLTIHPVYEIDFEDVVCEGSTYNNHGFDVTAVQTLGVSDVTMTQQLQSQDGCDSLVNLYLRVVDTSIAIVSLTADFCEEYTAELSVETNMTDYQWNTGETSQTITVNRPGTYMVTATQDNCSVTSWYTIENCELNIYLPNAITPSISDGLNDYFCLHEKYLPLIEDFKIRIYTRWGELVYYSDDKNFKWYGVRNPHTGEILINNIYTYLINFTDNRGIPHQLTGSITVL